ncbi:MAG: anion permease [Synergistaceae bacterium]|nr:anion permease [Synergistaceae bacterium]
MEKSTLALVIVTFTCILYASEWFSVAAVSLAGMLAMIYAGILTPSEAFSEFTNTAVLLVIGMVIIIDALIESGIAGRIGRILGRIKSEKNFVVIIFLLASLLSMFMTNASLVGMMMPFISSVAAVSGGRITKKHSYLPLAAGGLIGGTATLAGSTAPLLADNVLAQAGAARMHFLSPFPIAFAIVIAVAVCYWLFMYRLEVKCFNFEEVQDSSGNVSDIPVNIRKAVISSAVLFICIVLFVVRPFGWELGQIAVTGALFLCAAKCIDGKKALRNMYWSALITLGAALGLSKGFVRSGAGALIINRLVLLMGGRTTLEMMVTLFLLAGYVLSLFMSNGPLVSMLASVAVPMAVEAGIDPMPVAMACVFGPSLAMASPSATATITMVQVAGYRFRDYFIVGGLIGLIGLAVSWVTIILYYS